MSYSNACLYEIYVWNLKFGKYTFFKGFIVHDILVVVDVRVVIYCRNSLEPFGIFPLIPR